MGIVGHGGRVLERGLARVRRVGFGGEVVGRGVPVLRGLRIAHAVVFAVAMAGCGHLGSECGRFRRTRTGDGGVWRASVSKRVFASRWKARPVSPAHLWGGAMDVFRSLTSSVHATE